MYLSDRDIEQAVADGELLLPADAKIDPSSVDLPLDSVDTARVWNVQQFRRDQQIHGATAPQIHLGTFQFNDFAEKYTCPVPQDEQQLVYRLGDKIIIKPSGFLLWQTRGDVGTKADSARYICFVNGKSRLARTGIIVHFTAPTIHAGWHGHITLEIGNLGPFELVLRAGDVIAQLTVAQVNNPPIRTHKEAKSSTEGQNGVCGKRSSEVPPGNDVIRRRANTND